MSGSTIGGVVGGVIGAFFGAAQIGYGIGYAIGGAIDPEELRGPSIGDAQRQTSQAGIPRPVVYGHPAPFMGNIIDGEAKARKIENTEGGKGGPEVTTEEFILTSAIRICEGPIAGVLKIWRNDQLVYDVTSEADFPEYSGSDPLTRAAYIAAIRAKTSAFSGNIAIYLGDEAQLPDPTLEAIHGVGNTPYYRGTAYIVVKDDNVTDMRGAAAQWKFEVLSAATANDDVVQVLPSTHVDNILVGHSFLSGYGQAAVGAQTSGTVAQIFSLNDFVISNAFRIRFSISYSPFDLPPGEGATAAQLQFAKTNAVWDSGWWAPTQEEADAARIALGGTIEGINSIRVGTPSDVIVTIPRNAWGFIASYEGYGFGSESVGFDVDYPHATGLTAITASELPNVLLGDDGNLYVPDFVTPPDFETVTPDDVFLGPVVADIASRCNVPAANIDVSELAADIIPGFLVAQQGSGADCLIPTQRGFFYDMPEFDLKLRAIKRGQATVESVTESDLLESDNEQTRPQEVEYPRLVSVITQDPDANYAPIPQTSLRTSPDVNPTNEVSLPLAIPFRADQSRQIADKLQKVLWSQAEGRIELPLPEKFSVLTPSDTFTFDNRRWLVENTNYADGEMRVRAVYDRASAYNSNATGQPAAPPELPSSGIGGTTILYWLNISILRDQDDRPGFYVAVDGTGDGWRGTTIQGRIRDSDPWTDLGTVTNQSIVGNTTTILPDAVAEVIDTANTVRVDVTGDLSSITEEQLLNEGNPCIIGEELCQFQTATFVSTGIYDLSILTRGRLNSDPIEHPAGSRFVMLDAVTFIEAPSTWVGQTLQLRAVTLGTVADNAQTMFVVWDPALSLTEWPPVQFTGTRDVSNNITISWIGQGRLGSNMSAHNSQFMDGYRVTLTKSGVTKIYTTTSQSFPYPATQQTIDFGSATGTLDVSIAAMNRITGASAELTGSIP